MGYTMTRQVSRHFSVVEFEKDQVTGHKNARETESASQQDACEGHTDGGCSWSA